MGWNQQWVNKERYDNSNIRFNLTTIRSSSCDYSDAYIFLKETLTVSNMAAAGVAVKILIKK